MVLWRALWYTIFLGVQTVLQLSKQAQKGSVMDQIVKRHGIPSAEPAQAGLVQWNIWTGTVGRSRQARANLYTKDGYFVAFFCRYTVATRDNNGERVRTITSSHVVKNFNQLSRRQKKAARNWLTKMKNECHPPTRRLRHSSR